MSVVTGNFGGREVSERDRIDATDALDAFVNYLDGADAALAIVAYLPEAGQVVVGSNLLSTDSTLTVLDMGKFQMLTALLEGDGEGTHLFMDIGDDDDD